MKYVQDEIIARLFTSGQLTSYEKGDVILSDESDAEYVYFIKSGFVKIYSITNDGLDCIHNFYGEGDIFPLTWAYLGIGNKSLFYEAISYSQIWKISRTKFLQAIHSDLEISNAFSVQMAKQFQASTNRIDNLEYRKASERVAYGLLLFANRFGKNQDYKVLITIPITHELFANSINLTRESVSREIERLEKLRIIKKINHQICILNTPALLQKLNDPIGLEI